MLRNDFDDFHVHGLFLTGHVFAESIGLFESIGNLVVEIDIFSELFKVVFLAVHLEHLVDFVFTDQEPFSVVQRDPRVNCIVNEYFFIESVCVLPIAL